jgi:hypothetical protein
LRDTFNVIPTPSSLQLYTEIQKSGIPVDADLLIDVWKYAGEKPLTPKRFEKAQQLLDAAIIKARQGATNVSAPISTGSGTTGSVGVGALSFRELWELQDQLLLSYQQLVELPLELEPHFNKLVFFQIPAVNLLPL